MWQELCSVAFSWLICVIAVERIAHIITDAKIFFGWRTMWCRLAYPTDPSKGSKLVRWFCKKMCDLFSCFLCCSVWVSGLAAFTLPGPINSLPAAHNYVVKAFALVGFATLWHSIFDLIDRGRVNTYDITLHLKDEIGEDDGVTAE